MTCMARLFVRIVACGPSCRLLQSGNGRPEHPNRSESIGASQCSDMTWAAWRAFASGPAIVRAGIAMMACSIGSRLTSIDSIRSRWSSGDAGSYNARILVMASSNCLPSLIRSDLNHHPLPPFGNRRALEARAEELCWHRHRHGGRMEKRIWSETR
jgi:hypothetical protein